MTLIINGESRAFEEPITLLPDLLEQLGLSAVPVLVEHNGRAILRSELDQLALSNGDQLEIVQMVAGG